MRYYVKKIPLLLLLFISHLTAQIDRDAVLGLPTATTAEMLSIVSPYTGSVLYNTTDDLIYRYTGTEWRATEVAISSAEQLRFVRGNVNANGTIAQGAGFTVTKLTSSRYQIDFTTSFGGLPSVTFTTGDLAALNSYEDNFANIIFLSNSRVVIVTADNTGENAREDSWFSFIAVGPE